MQLNALHRHKISVGTGTPKSLATIKHRADGMHLGCQLLMADLNSEKLADTAKRISFLVLP